MIIRGGVVMRNVVLRGATTLAPAYWEALTVSWDSSNTTWDTWQ